MRSKSLDAAKLESETKIDCTDRLDIALLFFLSIVKNHDVAVVKDIADESIKSIAA